MAYLIFFCFNMRSGPFWRVYGCRWGICDEVAIWFLRFFALLTFWWIKPLIRLLTLKDFHVWTNQLRFLLRNTSKFINNWEFGGSKTKIFIENLLWTMPGVVQSLLNDRENGNIKNFAQLTTGKPSKSLPKKSGNKNCISWFLNDPWLSK